MNEKTPFWSSLPGILTGLAGVLAGVVGLLTAFGLGDSDDPSKSAPSTPATRAATGPRRSTVSASITAPRQGDGICFRQAVRGTAKGVPESSELWVVVYAPDIERFFPADPAKRVIREGKTNWSDVAYVGASPKDDNVDDPYELQIVSASKSASRLFADYVRGPARELGLQTLPSGTERLDKVFVTRDAC